MSPTHRWSRCALRWSRCDRSEPRDPVTRTRPSPTSRLLAPALAALLLLLLAGPAAAADRPAPADGVWPLQPRPAVVARFDPPTTRFGRGHRGVDLSGHVAQRVRAAVAGRVSFAGRLAGRGVVVVDHGGTRTTYEPVLASVSVGDRVAAGATLGRLQLVGSHCFPRTCLHWGLIAGRDHYLDPLTLVGGGPVRLLPLTGPLGPPTFVGPSPGANGPWTPPGAAAPKVAARFPAALGQAALPPADRTR